MNKKQLRVDALALELNRLQREIVATATNLAFAKTEAERLNVSIQEAEREDRFSPTSVDRYLRVKKEAGTSYLPTTREAQAAQETLARLNENKKLITYVNEVGRRDRLRSDEDRLLALKAKLIAQERNLQMRMFTAACAEMALVHNPGVGTRLGRAELTLAEALYRLNLLTAYEGSSTK